MVDCLAANGYLHYLAVDGESRFVHRHRLPTLWKAVLDGDVKVSDRGIFYKIEESDNAPKRLLVVFSGMPKDPNEGSPWRYFTQNYRHAHNAIPGDCVMLRVADVGGVKGSFYSNTADDPSNQEDISSLISATARDRHIPDSRVCLLGCSKGATGAVLHGLTFGWNFVAVDPVLSDSYYEIEMSDLHFTSGNVFLDSKDVLFDRLSEKVQNNVDNDLSANYSIFLTSRRSAQYGRVCSFVQSIAKIRPSLFSFDDPRIKSHPDVARSVMWATMPLVVCALMGFRVPRGPVDL